MKVLAATASMAICLGTISCVSSAALRGARGRSQRDELPLPLPARSGGTLDEGAQ